jgi:multiple sugar transport system ATP-binding protein
MVYVTHDQVEAMTMGDRIVVLRDGEVQQIDTPLSLYNQPANQFVAGFIGSPAMNFVDGHLEKNGRLFFQADTLRLPVPAHYAKKLEPFANQSVILGVRPEHIYYSAESENATAAFSAHIEVVEPMGNETVIYMRAGSHNLTARILPQSELQVGTEYQLGIDLDKIHFFATNQEIIN